MRDIVKDAAFITVAKQAMADESFIGVETFVEYYAKSEEDKEEFYDTLSLFGLAYSQAERYEWDLTYKRRWYWSNDR